MRDLYTSKLKIRPHKQRMAYGRAAPPPPRLTWLPAPTRDKIWMWDLHALFGCGMLMRDDINTGCEYKIWMRDLAAEVPWIRSHKCGASRPDARRSRMPRVRLRGDSECRIRVRDLGAKYRCVVLMQGLLRDPYSESRCEKAPVDLGTVQTSRTVRKLDRDTGTAHFLGFPASHPKLPRKNAAGILCC